MEIFTFQSPVVLGNNLTMIVPKNKQINSLIILRQFGDRRVTSFFISSCSLHLFLQIYNSENTCGLGLG